MDEPNKSALVLLQQEATELLALFDQLRGDLPSACANEVLLGTSITTTSELIRPGFPRHLKAMENGRFGGVHEQQA
ncbi:hypothetical protein, partial [Xanthomonas floridensis]